MPIQSGYGRRGRIEPDSRASATGCARFCTARFAITRLTRAAAGPTGGRGAVPARGRPPRDARREPRRPARGGRRPHRIGALDQEPPRAGARRLDHVRDRPAGGRSQAAGSPGRRTRRHDTAEPPGRVKNSTRRD
ncbi:hypothetical protein GCM10009660_02930 [Catellatospora bangladeshensis]